MIAVDLGQSGCRISIEGKIHSSNRGKLAGELVLVSLEENFKNIDAKSELVTLSLTGFLATLTMQDRICTFALSTSAPKKLQ